MGDAELERVVGFPFRRLAAEEGVLTPDYVVACPPGSTRRVERLLFDLRPGVTELAFHPGADTDELRAACVDWSGRVADYAYLTRDASLPDLLTRAQVTTIGWRDLRDVQRAA